MSEKFRLKKGDHVVTTSLASEAVKFRAAGYSDVKKPGPAPKQVSPDKK